MFAIFVTVVAFVAAISGHVGWAVFMLFILVWDLAITWSARRRRQG